MTTQQKRETLEILHRGEFKDLFQSIPSWTTIGDSLETVKKRYPNSIVIQRGDRFYEWNLKPKKVDPDKPFSWFDDYVDETNETN